MKGTVKEKWKGIKAERDCKGKMKGGKGWNLRISGVDRYL